MKRRDEKGGAERNNWIHSHIIFYISTHSNIGFITFRDFIHIPISVKLTETATVDIPTTTFISTKRNETKWNKAYCCECKCECEWDEFFFIWHNFIEAANVENMNRKYLTTKSYRKIVRWCGVFISTLLLLSVCLSVCAKEQEQVNILSTYLILVMLCALPLKIMRFYLFIWNFVRYYARTTPPSPPLSIPLKYPNSIFIRFSFLFFSCFSFQCVVVANSSLYLFFLFFPFPLVNITFFSSFFLARFLLFSAWMSSFCTTIHFD